MKRLNKNWRVHASWAAAVLAAIALTWAATSVVLTPVASAPPDAQPQTYTVARGEVGETIAAQASVRFADAREVMAGRGGVITTLPHAPSEPIGAGTVLATIDMRPVVAAPGAVPAFRDMALGVRGPDVAQLRAFLGEEDGDTFDAQTDRLVRAWQAEVGLPVDGAVHLGDIVYAPSLPARGAFAEGVSLGAQIAPGTPLFVVKEARPQLLVPADANVRILTGMTARVLLPGGGEVVGELAGPFQGPDGLQSFEVLDAEGDSACDERCAAQFDLQGSFQVSVEVETVPTVEGLIVPDSALVTRPDGSIAVRRAGGELAAVTVNAQGSGLSVVSGIEEGAVIQLFDSGQNP